ncbi:hypothetical protein GJAV_G00242220 [Gymnothorax javanicus]|nr:hypothetical protein GJAV_G00242220 [Gymnothorax javanicus]
MSDTTAHCHASPGVGPLGVGRIERISYGAAFATLQHLIDLDTGSNPRHSQQIGQRTSPMATRFVIATQE